MEQPGHQKQQHQPLAQSYISASFLEQGIANRASCGSAPRTPHHRAPLNPSIRHTDTPTEPHKTEQKEEGCGVGVGGTSKRGYVPLRMPGARVQNLLYGQSSACNSAAHPL
eukprot:SAG11_NODE_5619_length_1506_cov_1.194741_2_plen_111_part_00